MVFPELTNNHFSNASHDRSMHTVISRTPATTSPSLFLSLTHSLSLVYHLSYPFNPLSLIPIATPEYSLPRATNVYYLV